MHWDEAASTLTIGEREGSFPGMIQSRDITVSLVSTKSHEEPLRTIRYDGSPVSIKL